MERLIELQQQIASVDREIEKLQATRSSLHQEAVEALREAAETLGVSVVRGKPSRRKPRSAPARSETKPAAPPTATERGRIEAWLRSVLAEGPLSEAELRQRFAKDKVGQRLRIKTYLQTGVLKRERSSRKISLA